MNIFKLTSHHLALRVYLYMYACMDVNEQNKNNFSIRVLNWQNCQQYTEWWFKSHLLLDSKICLKNLKEWGWVRLRRAQVEPGHDTFLYAYRSQTHIHTHTHVNMVISLGGRLNLSLSLPSPTWPFTHTNTVTYTREIKMGLQTGESCVSHTHTPLHEKHKQHRCPECGQLCMCCV